MDNKYRKEKKHKHFIQENVPLFAGFHEASAWRLARASAGEWSNNV